MIDLGEFYPDFREILADLVNGIVRAPADALGPLCEQACVYFRSAGVADVLVGFDSDGFLHMLTRSALTRIYLLARTPPALKQNSRFCKISRANGFFDSLGANRADLAARIIAEGPSGRNSDYEYEDEYLYVRFLYGVLQCAGRGDQQKILDDWKVALDGTPSAKHKVCAMLLERDSAGFDDAFSSLLSIRKRELEAEERSLNRDEMAFAANRHVYVEGLAILRLAGMLGIATEPEYRYCPKEMRAPLVELFPNDLYPGAPV
jgi:hypothetical protein